MNRALLFDLVKIVDGAANGDPNKIVAHVRQLSDKLEAAGEPALAKDVREIIAKGKLTSLVLASEMKVPEPAARIAAQPAAAVVTYANPLPKMSFTYAHERR